MHSPTVKGARTEDLRAELNRRHAAEDTRVSIERARNRRLNAEGRNLGANLEAAAPSAPGDARARTGTPVAGVGCAALAKYLRAATWPSMFRPHEAFMASYFHVALTGPARTWLMNLTPRSIRSWEELCTTFTRNFAIAYQQHGVEAHLHAVRQKSGESLRVFISRFTKVRGTIPRISDASVITAFRQ